MKIEESYLKSLIGMTKEDAINLCEDNKFLVRVDREDDINHIGTLEFNPIRVRLVVKNNIVIETDIG